jgi:hypothetical protein
MGCRQRPDGLRQTQISGPGIKSPPSHSQPSGLALRLLGRVRSMNKGNFSSFYSARSALVEEGVRSIFSKSSLLNKMLTSKYHCGHSILMDHLNSSFEHRSADLHKVQAFAHKHIPASLKLGVQVQTNRMQAIMRQETLQFALRNKTDSGHILSWSSFFFHMYSFAPTRFCSNAQCSRFASSPPPRQPALL